MSKSPELGIAKSVVPSPLKSAVTRSLGVFPNWVGAPAAAKPPVPFPSRRVKALGREVVHVAVVNNGQVGLAVLVEVCGKHDSGVQAHRNR